MEKIEFIMPTKGDKKENILIMKILRDFISLSKKFFEHDDELSDKEFVSVLTDAANKNKVFVEYDDTVEVLKKYGCDDLSLTIKGMIDYAKKLGE